VPRRNATRLEDVAKAAGVHASTASRVLNSSTVPIGDETRRRVLQAARRLHYRPNAIARGLKLAETGALGLLVPSLRNPVFADIIHGAFRRAAERGFVVLLVEDTGDVEAQRAYRSLVEEGRIDGVLVASARAGSSVLERLGTGAFPSVFLNRRQIGSGRNVAMREEDAGRIAAERFLELGHRRLGQLAGLSELDTAQRRMAGFVETAAREGIKPEVVRASYEEADARAAMRELLALDPRPTAIFISNLNQAIGAVAAVRDAGVRVPEELSLIACDDDPIIDFLEPLLTTIRMPLAELGAAAVDALLAQIDGGEPEDVVVPVAPELVERDSTAPPAA
jgi:LacI family transcriptional regulator